MNRAIFDAVKIAYDIPDAYSTSKLPYTIHTTTAFGNMSKGIVNLIAKMANEKFSVSSYDCLICCWNPEALSHGSDTDSESSGDDATEQDGVSVSAVDVEIPNINMMKVKDWLDVGINGTTVAGHDEKNKGGVISVMQCFDKFIEREQMPPEETWYCAKCKQHLAPVKKFDIWSAPEILVVHLKRFQYTSRASFTFRDKVNLLIDFPIEGLDLRDYVKSSMSSDESNPAIYDLYGVSEHSGNLGGGHYTARCLNEKSGKWFSFNDSFVRECTPESAITTEAYVLFYKRRHGHLKWGGLRPSEEPLEN
jgi:hypothetical protein